MLFIHLQYIVVLNHIKSPFKMKSEFFLDNPIVESCYNLYTGFYFHSMIKVLRIWQRSSSLKVLWTLSQWLKKKPLQCYWGGGVKLLVIDLFWLVAPEIMIFFIHTLQKKTKKTPIFFGINVFDHEIFSGSLEMGKTNFCSSFDRWTV